MKRTIFFRLAACFLIFLSPDLFCLDIKTDFTESKDYRTVGIFSTAAEYNTVSRVLTDFESYNRWVLRGLDGKDPGTEDFIGLMKETVYHREREVLELIYDVRLPWPLGSLGNSALFDITILDRSSNSLTFNLDMTNTSAALKSASLDVTVFPENQGCRIETTALIHFSFFLNLLFNLPAYKKTIEWRIVRVMLNMEAFIETCVQSESLIPGG
ncbi:MAG: hypothetical protein JW760_07380 [Spirochaetales bacterium]|nr:hypothetical protein [Spirochaetales bacterium]